MTSREEFEKETGININHDSSEYEGAGHEWKTYAEWLERRNEWVSVEERLPGYDEVVLFWSESGNIFQSFIDKDMLAGDIKRFLKGTYYGGPITHWIKPTPPDEAKRGRG